MQAGNDLFEIDNKRTELTDIVRVTDYALGDQLSVNPKPVHDTRGAEPLPIITYMHSSGNSGILVMFGDAAIANVIGGQDLDPVNYDCGMFGLNAQHQTRSTVRILGVISIEGPFLIGFKTFDLQLATHRSRLLLGGLAGPH